MNDLPVEICIQIFTILPFSDFLSCRVVNKRLYQAGSQCNLWKHLYTYKHEYLSEPDYYRRALIRGQHNVLVQTIWHNMTLSFHVLPYFHYLQTTFGLNLVEYCQSKLNSIPQYEQLTLKYYIKKTMRTVIRLCYINHFLKRDYSDLFLNCIYVGFITDPDLDPKNSDIYLNELNRLLNEAQYKIDPNLPIRQRAILLLQLFFKGWGFKVDSEHFNSIDHACLHRCLITKKGMPILLCVLLYYLGKSCEIQFQLVGFPTKFLLSIEIDDEICYISPSEYNNNYPFLHKNDLIRNLRSLTIPENDFQMHLKPVEHSQVVERCLNNLMLCISQTPSRSLSWFSSIYTCSWCCFLSENMNILEPEFIYEMFLNAYCEDAIIICEIIKEKKYEDNSFNKYYHDKIMGLYNVMQSTDDTALKRMDEFLRLYQKMEDILPANKIEINKDAPMYSFNMDLPDNMMQQILELLPKVLTRDLLPLKKDLSEIKCKFGIGDVVYHSKYDYYAVIHDMDSVCTEGEDWQRIMRKIEINVEVKSLMYQEKQPFYNVIVLSDQSNRYVAQENIVSVANDETLKLEFIREMALKPDFLFFCGQFFTKFDSDTFAFTKNCKTDIKYYP